jgi:hypothetical protein
LLKPSATEPTFAGAAPAAEAMATKKPAAVKAFTVLIIFAPFVGKHAVAA